MTLLIASVLLVLTVICFVLVLRCLREKQKLRIICLVLLSLNALLLVGYIGLSFI